MLGLFSSEQIERYNSLGSMTTEVIEGHYARYTVGPVFTGIGFDFFLS